MDSWREVAARVVAEEGQGHSQAEPSPTLPAFIASGLAALAAMPPPRRLQTHGAWMTALADAARLGADGWAVNALALGWHPLELFGIGLTSSADFEGLAVWLAGRRLVLLDERIAVAVDGARRAVFSRRGLDPSAAGRVVFLWEFGRA